MSMILQFEERVGMEAAIFFCYTSSAASCLRGDAKIIGFSQLHVDNVLEDIGNLSLEIRIGRLKCINLGTEATRHYRRWLEDAISSYARKTSAAVRSQLNCRAFLTPSAISQLRRVSSSSTSRMPRAISKTFSGLTMTAA